MADRKQPARRRVQKKAPTERALLFTVERLQVIDESSGEVITVAALVPYEHFDRRMLREREFRVGDIIMADLHKERHGKFFRLWHKLAEFVADNTEDLAGMRSHDALKRLQADAGVHCHRVRYELEDGTPIFRTEAMSLNFNDTDETVAQEVWTALCDYIARTYFPTWDATQVAEAAEYWQRDQQT